MNKATEKYLHPKSVFNLGTKRRSKFDGRNCRAVFVGKSSDVNILVALRFKEHLEITSRAKFK